MGKVIGCIIARTVSKRLPLKVLRSIGGEYTLLDYIIKRLKTVQSIDEIYICTSSEDVDDILEDIASRNHIRIFRGSPVNVISRMLGAGKIADAEILLRVTGDNPLTAVEYIDEQVRLLRNKKLDYVRLIDVPLGATAEVMTSVALEKCNKMMDPAVSEYLMLFMFEPKHFRCGVIKPFANDFSDLTVTIDTPEDLARTNLIMHRWQKRGTEISLENVLTIIKGYDIPNTGVKNSGKIKLPYGKSIDFEEFVLDMKRRITQSELLKLYA